MNPDSVPPPDERSDLQDSPEEKPRRSRTRWLIILLGLGAVAILAGQWRIAEIIDARVNSLLAARGWTLQREKVSWGPIQGLRMHQVAVGRSGQAPALELRSLDLELPWSSLLGRTPRSIQLSSARSPMILRDRDGEIRFQRVSLELEATKDQVLIRDFSARKDGLIAKLDGKILVAGNPAEEMSSWEPDFGAVRSTLAALKVDAKEGAFSVKGGFEVDARAATTRWSAKLEGKGKSLVWQGIPLKDASSEALLSDRDSMITSTLALSHGEATFKVERGKWASTPFVFNGTINDGNKRRSDFEGIYDTGEHTWLLKRLRGSADLWAIARDVPRFAAHLPDGVTIDTFPGIDLRRASVVRGEPWKMESILLTSAAAATVTVNGQEVRITGIRGNVSREKDAWAIHRCVGSLLGGDASLSGVLRDDDGRLRNATVSAKGLKLASVKDVAGEETGSKGVLSFNYRGDVNFEVRELDGRGTMQLDNAPVIEVPLLDQTYDLFAAIIPGVERADRGRFEASFIGIRGAIDVPRFEASGGSLTVSAKGRVDLVKRRVDGVARGKLSGLPGTVTKPLSRLLEMEVGGPFDDIRVKPLGPAKLASNAVSGTVGVPVETLEEAGRITGTIIAEGIKMPFRWLEERRAGKGDEQ